MPKNLAARLRASGKRALVEAGTPGVTSVSIWPRSIDVSINGPHVIVAISSTGPPTRALGIEISASNARELAEILIRAAALAEKGERANSVT